MRRNSHGRYCLLQHSATYVDCIVVSCGGRSVEVARTVRWHGFKLIKTRCMYYARWGERERERTVCERVFVVHIRGMIMYVFIPVATTKNQAKEREEEARRRHQRRVDNFLDLLVDYYHRDDHLDVTWDEVRVTCNRTLMLHSLCQ